MKRVAISELKASLSEWLSGVKSGEELIVTDRGIPVARLSPVTGHRDSSLQLTELSRAGLIRLPEKKTAISFSKVSTRIKDPSGSVVKNLIKERESGW